MTVEQFQKLSKVQELDLPEEEKATLYVKAMTGLSEGEINRMQVKKFNKLCAKVQAAFAAKNYDLENGKPRKFKMVNGTMYRFNYDLKRPPNNAGRYIEVATYASDIIGNLHLIMATMATPYKWLKPTKPESWQHEQIANDMKQLDFAVAYHAAVFFCGVFNKSMTALQPYLIQELSREMNPEQAKEILQASLKVLDGFTMPKWYRILKISV
jgi:hypothetical protein